MTVPAQSLPYDTDIAPAAALMADPTRAAILRALLPDRPLAAGELARLAGVSAATASFHLGKLLEGGMIVVARQGRHRYYWLGGRGWNCSTACSATACSRNSHQAERTEVLRHPLASKSPGPERGP